MNVYCFTFFVLIYCRKAPLLEIAILRPTESSDPGQKPLPAICKKTAQAMMGFRILHDELHNEFTVHSPVRWIIKSHIYYIAISTKRISGVVTSVRQRNLGR